MIIRQNCS